MLMFVVSCGVLLSYKSIAQTTSPVEQRAQYLIMFDFSNIDDAHYSTNDSNFYLEYDDPDAFDLDQLAEATGRNEWYGEYITINIQDSLVSLFLIEWGEYINLKNYVRENWTPEMGYIPEWKRMYEISESWGIQEIWIAKDIRYELVYVGKEYNWYE